MHIPLGPTTVASADITLFKNYRPVVKNVGNVVGFFNVFINSPRSVNTTPLIGGGNGGAGSPRGGLPGGYGGAGSPRGGAPSGYGGAVPGGYGGLPGSPLSTRTRKHFRGQQL